MSEQEISNEVNRDIQTYKEKKSDPSQADTDRKRKQEESLFDKIEDALGIDDSTFETNLLPPERD
jgi:hypothetical protein